MAHPPALILLVVGLAVAARATPIPQGAIDKAKDIQLCWQSNPFSTGALPRDESRATLWNNACIDQADACSLLSGDAEREKVKDGYCLSCVNKPAPGGCADGTSCEPAKVCKAPQAKVVLAPPAEGEGNFQGTPLAPQSDGSTAACGNTPGCISRYVSSVYLNGASWKDQVNSAWAASRVDRDHNDFSKCDELTLRNTEHYLYHYWSRLDSQVYNQLPLAFCGISYGYTAVKWLGIKQAIMNDPGKDSPPSMEEAYWGCRGLWDAYEPEQKIAVGVCR